MDGPGEHYGKWKNPVRETTQWEKQPSERKTNTIWFQSYVESNEQTTNKQNTDRLIDREHADSCQRQGLGGMEG